MLKLGRRPSLHLDAASYLMELLFLYNENLRSVVLSQVGHRTVRCLRQLGGLGVLRGVFRGFSEEARTRGIPSPSLDRFGFVVVIYKA
jgi:hypothetical protein